MATDENSYPNPGNYPAPSFRRPIPLPDIPPDEGDLIYVGYNPAWTPALMGAVTQLLLPSTWQGDHEDIINALNEASVLQWLLTEPVALSEGTPTPYWTDAENVDDSLPAELQPWYGFFTNFDESWEDMSFVEQATIWAYSGMIAVAETPGAAIVFRTTISRFLFAVRQRDFGGIVRLMIDGEDITTVDTSADPDTITYVPVVGDPEVLEHEFRVINVSNSGIGAMELHPIEVVRKFLSEDELGARNLRYDPGTNQVQFTRDGGVTWEENPEADPRRQLLFPPLTGSLARCRAAASAVAFLQDFFDQTLAHLAAGATALGAAWFVLALLEPTFFGELIWAIWTFFTGFILDVGVQVIDEALTSDVYRKLQCIFITLYDDDGRFPEENLPRLYAALHEELEFVPAQLIDLCVDAMGFAGLSNIAAQDLRPLEECECYECNDNVTLNFNSGFGWQVMPVLYGNSLCVWEATGGRNDNGGCVKGTPAIPANNYSGLMIEIDLGQACHTFDVQWYARTNGTGQYPPENSVLLYDANHVLINQANNRNSPGNNQWTFQGYSFGSSNLQVRYVRIRQNAYQGDIWIDDVWVRRHL